MRLDAGEDDAVSFEDLKSAAAIGSFVLAVGTIVAAWIAWRAVVAVKLDTLKENLKSLANQQSKQAEAQLAFEREVRTSYATTAAISDIRSDITDIRADIARGCAGVTERIDKVISR